MRDSGESNGKAQEGAAPCFLVLPRLSRASLELDGCTPDCIIHAKTLVIVALGRSTPPLSNMK